MNTLPSRITLVCVIVALFLGPLYAHHGNLFLSKAMETNAAEVRLGQMAVNKTQNPRVKDFGQMVFPAGRAYDPQRWPRADLSSMQQNPNMRFQQSMMDEHLWRMDE